MDIRDEHTSLVFSTIAVAVLGAFVKWLRKDSHNWLKLIVMIITSGFIGLLSHYATNYLELDIHLQFFFSGIAGYVGGGLLDDTATQFRGFVNSGANVFGKATGAMNKKTDLL